MDRDITISVIMTAVGSDIASRIQALPISASVSDNLSSSHDSFLRRMQSVQAGLKSRVDFKRLLKKHIIRILEGFSEGLDTGDSQHFSLPITEEVSLVLVFGRIHHWGLGKAFDVKFRIEVKTASYPRPLHFEKSLFSLPERTSSPCFTYQTKEELEVLLQGIASFILSAVPFFRMSIMNSFRGQYEELPPYVAVNGPMDTLTAYDMIVSRFPVDGKSCYIGGIQDAGFYELRSHHGPCISASGVLNPHGAWRYAFIDVEHRTFKWITIGYYGGFEEEYFPWTEDSHILPLQREWVHSKADFELANANGGSAFLNSLREMAYVSYEMQHEPDRYRCEYPLARIAYSGKDPDGSRIDRMFRVNVREQVFVGLGP